MSSHPSTTPIAWTRGLQSTGVWADLNAIYGGDGGHIVFMGGNVAFYRNVASRLVVPSTGETTSDILEIQNAITGGDIKGQGPQALGD